MEQVVLTHCLIGHTRNTPNFILNDETITRMHFVQFILYYRTSY